jgi:sialidase-1
MLKVRCYIVPVFLSALVFLAIGVAPRQLPAAEATSQLELPVFVASGKVTYRLPSLLVTSQGTVLAACQKRLGGGGDFAPSSMVLRRSFDGGKTFEREQTLFEHQGVCTFNGNLVEERNSRTIFACFLSFPQADGPGWFPKTWIPRGGGFSIIKSTDDGQTWSSPIEVMPRPNAEGWHGAGVFNNNHGVQIERGLHKGRLVIAARVFKPGVYEGRAKAGLIYSDDRGETWHVGGVVLKELGDLASEVALGETADGEIYVNCRNSVEKSVTRPKKAGQAAGVPVTFVPHQRIYARSRDGGESFYEEGCHAELYDEPCNAGLAFYPPDDGRDGLQLFSAPVGPRRTQLTGFVSRDGGRTWKAGQIISEKAGGYSDLAVLPDKTILTFYEDHGRMLLARYSLAWLTGQ